MKRTTYIMFTLIIGGIVLIASLFTYVKIAGVECDNTWRNPIVISESVRAVELPSFNKLDISSEYINNDGEVFSSYVNNGMHVVVATDSVAEAPYATLPVNLAKDIDIEVGDNALNFKIILADRYYRYDDETSAPITIYLPVGADLNTITYFPEMYSHLVVESLTMENLAVNINDQVYLYLNHCHIGDVTATSVNYLNVYDSVIDSMTVRGRENTDVIYSRGTRVGATQLRGDDVTFDLKGVEVFTAHPDSASLIRVTQVYED